MEMCARNELLKQSKRQVYKPLFLRSHFSTTIVENSRDSLMG